MGKSQEKKLTDQMKIKFRLVKKSRGYAISFISDGVVEFSAQILEGKILWKCPVNEVSAPVVSLAAQCSQGVQLNWEKYLCHEFLEDFCEAQEDGKLFHYVWLLLLIALVGWNMPEDIKFPT